MAPQHLFLLFKIKADKYLFIQKKTKINNYKIQISSMIHNNFTKKIRPPITTRQWSSGGTQPGRSWVRAPLADVALEGLRARYGHFQLRWPLVGFTWGDHQPSWMPSAGSGGPLVVQIHPDGLQVLVGSPRGIRIPRLSKKKKHV